MIWIGFHSWSKVTWEAKDFGEFLEFYVRRFRLKQ